MDHDANLMKRLRLAIGSLLGGRCRRLRRVGSKTAPPAGSACRALCVHDRHGSNHHRPNAKRNLPDGVRTLPEWTLDAGYSTMNLEILPESFGTKEVDKRDWNFASAEEDSDSANPLEQRKQEKKPKKQP